MAFRTHRWTCWAAGFLTAVAARTADAQVYGQVPAPTGQYNTPQYAAPQQPANPQYPRQPAVRQQSPQQPGYPQSQNQPAAYPQYQTPPANQQYPNQSAANPQYQNQPGAYGSQPARQQLPPNREPPQLLTPEVPPARCRLAAKRRIPNNTVLAAHRAAVLAPAQFEQPVDQQQSGGPQQPATSNDPPGFRATEVSTSALSREQCPPMSRADSSQEHPLLPALRWAKQGLDEFTKVHDYSCTLVKRGALTARWASTSTSSSKCGTSRSACIRISSARPA